MMIIDPPVTPYSSTEEIEAWIDELDEKLEKEKNEVVRLALQRAILESRKYLKWKSPRLLPGRG